jgi:Transglycosylase SLT domain
MVRHFVVVSVALLALVAVTGPAARANEYDHLVAKHASTYGVPESLVRRVIHIESKGNPRVVSSGNYGLMQIRLGTARAMGYGGDANGLLDADTNMTYAVRYLAGAYRAAGGNQDQAIRNYQRGFYDKAKAQGFSPYAAPSALPQAAAPDPTILPRQQETVRQQVAEKQQLERHAMLEARIEQQKVAEEERMTQRRAALQARVDQQKAAEQARAAQRHVALQERIDRQKALQQKLIEQRNAVEQKRSEQRQAVLQQRLDRDQARQKAAAAQPAETPKVEPQVQSSVQPIASQKRAAPEPAYAWYNPMRFFKHPAHQANPIPRYR